MPAPRRQSSVVVYALTREGAALARRIGAGLTAAGRPAEARVLDRYARPGEAAFQSLAADVATVFPAASGLVFVAATGIVVRTLAPLIVHKTADPGVVAVDQAGRFAVSLLSGHLGGGNDLARLVAGITGGQPVITTATDVAGVPAIDCLAAARGLATQNPEAIRHVASALLDGRTVGVHDPDGWLGELPEGLTRVPAASESGVLVSWRDEAAACRALILRPPALFAGVGCRAGTDVDEIEALIRETFAREGLALPSLAGLATVEAKAGEPGLLQAAARLGLPLLTYPADELAAVPVPTPSLAPLKAVGTPSVCEAAAILSAQAAGTKSRLLLPKTKTARVTLAVAVANSR